MTKTFFVDAEDAVYKTLEEVKKSGKSFRVWYYEQPYNDSLSFMSTSELEKVYKSGLCTDKSNNARY